MSVCPTLTLNHVRASVCMCVLKIQGSWVIYRAKCGSEAINYSYMHPIDQHTIPWRIVNNQLKP